MRKTYKISRASQLWNYLRVIFADKDRKSLPRMLLEYLTFSVRGRKPAGYYFTSLLYKKSVPNAGDYLNTREMYGSQRALSDLCAAEITANKLFFQYFFTDKKVALPRLLAYNFGRRLSVEGGTPVELDTPETLRGALRGLLAVTSSSSLFIKPINGSSGKGTRKVAGSVDGLSAEVMAELHHHLLSANFLFQETVVQHPGLDRLNASSLNTIRIDTYKDAEGRVEVISALLRVGLAGSVVDNSSQGGLFAGIDMDRGTLKGPAIRDLTAGALVYPEHPDTRVLFQDFPVPHFELVRRLAAQAADLMPPALIGWDVAVAPDGPRLIEGNTLYYGMEMSDMSYGGYRKHPVVQRFLRDARDRMSAAR